MFEQWELIDPYKPAFQRISKKDLERFYINLYLKFRNLQSNVHEEIERRAHELLQQKAYEEYRDTAREIANYFRTHPDFRTLSTPARMGVQFLIKVRDIWRRGLESRKDYKRVYRLLWLDLLPPADQEEIKEFLDGGIPRHWKYQDWELEIVKDPSLSSVEAAYKIGRSIESVWWYRYTKLKWRKRKRRQEFSQNEEKCEKARI